MNQLMNGRAGNRPSVWSSGSWAIFGSGLAVVVSFAASFPRLQVVFRMDEWDYIDELLRLPLWEFLQLPNPGGHRTPLAKALFAVTIEAGAFTASIANVVNLAVNLASLVVIFLILRRCGIVGAWTVVLLATLRANYVGVADVFSFPLTGCLQLALLMFFVAVLLLLETEEHPLTGRQLLGLMFALASAILSFGSGALAPVALFVALVVSRAQTVRHQVRRPEITALLALQVMAITVIHQAPSASVVWNARSIATYFFYGTLVNGAISGLMPRLVGGWVHIAYLALLGLGCLWILLGSRSFERRFVVAAFGGYYLLLGLATAIARAPGAESIAHASSYRYVYMNLVLQIPLLAVVWQEWWERLPRQARTFRWAAVPTAASLLLAVTGTLGAMQARVDLNEAELVRRDCLSRILDMTADRECVREVYLKDDAETVRRATAAVQQWRASREFAVD